MRKLVFFAVLLLTLFVTLSFAEDDKMVAVGGIDPSAIGNIHTDQDQNGNVRMHVSVQHLAVPTKLSTPKQHYVVWVQPPGQPPQPVGELRVNNKEEGSVDATTPAKVFDVTVTAEDSPSPTAPTGPEVLKGHVERK